MFSSCCKCTNLRSHELNCGFSWNIFTGLFRSIFRVSTAAARCGPEEGSNALPDCVNTVRGQTEEEEKARARDEGRDRQQSVVR